MEQKINIFDKSCACYAIDCGCDSFLNEHGKYIVRFARNHGISIAEAQNAPICRFRECETTTGAL